MEQNPKKSLGRKWLGASIWLLVIVISIKVLGEVAENIFRPDAGRMINLRSSWIDNADGQSIPSSTGPVTDSGHSHPEPSGPYRDVDAYAWDAPEDVCDDPIQLAEYLAKVPNASETRKARAAFAWIATNISYDLQRLEQAQPLEVLQSRRAVCAGYAELLKTLCCAMSLKCNVVTGRVNQAIASETHQVGKHAWNAIKIDNSWMLVDVTWASAGSEGIREGFFLVPPEQFIYSHYPDHASWQFLGANAWTISQFEAMPRIEPEFFRLGLQLGSHARGDVKKTSHMTLWFQLPESDATFHFTAGIKNDDKSYPGVSSKSLVLENGRLPESRRYELKLELPGDVPDGAKLVIYAGDRINSGFLTPVVIYRLVN